MGMERVTSIMQNKVSNYATDVFGELASSCHEGCSAMTLSCRSWSSNFVAQVLCERSSRGVRCLVECLHWPLDRLAGSFAMVS